MVANFAVDAAEIALRMWTVYVCLIGEGLNLTEYTG